MLCTIEKLFLIIIIITENENLRQKPSFKRRVIKHAGKVALAIVVTSLAISPVQANEIDAINSKSGKKAMNEALKFARSKPALSIAGTIVCLSCVPAVGAAVF